MADRRKLLARIERVRAVERQEALASLTAARAEQARMEEVARRSRALVGSGLPAGGVHDGGGLASALAFHARLAGLVSDADRLGARAAAGAHDASTALARADRRLDLVRERTAQETARADARQLARGLLSVGQTPRRSA